MDEEWVEYGGGVVRNWHRSARRIRVAPGVAVIPEEAFSDCEDLIAVDLSDVTTIYDRAFLNCRSLERVVLPTDSAVEIGELAFFDCKSLVEIDLGNVTKIGADAFFECVALERVSIPSSVAIIEARAFADCNNLTEVGLAQGIQRIGRGAFRGAALERINIPSSVMDIGDGAFCGCSSLEEVELNEGLQQIGSSAFYRCTSLLRINVPSTTLKVGSMAFQACSQLRYAELREGLQTIGEAAFIECQALERITTPSSTTLVGRGAFRDCNNLAEVTLREGVHFIEDGAFNYCPTLEHINIPPVAFVIDIERSSCQLMRTTMPVIEYEGRLVVSKWLQYMSPSRLEQAEAEVNEILGRQLTEDEKIECIRDWSAYCELLDVTTLLELTVWRDNLDGDEQDTAARQASRRNCGNDMNVIIPCVLPFLDATAAGGEDGIDDDVDGSSDEDY